MPYTAYSYFIGQIKFLVKMTVYWRITAKKFSHIRLAYFKLLWKNVAVKLIALNLRDSVKIIEIKK